MILFDTDILTLYLAGHSRVGERTKKANETPVTSVISGIEVLQGRFDSVLKAADGAQLLKGQARLAVAEGELAKFDIIPVDARASDGFDRLRQNKKLKQIGRADLLIACIALAQGATLVTRNLKHFRQVPGLKVENWAD